MHFVLASFFLGESAAPLRRFLEPRTRKLFMSLYSHCLDIGIIVISTHLPHAALATNLQPIHNRHQASSIPQAVELILASLSNRCCNNAHFTPIKPTPSLATLNALFNACSSTSVHFTLNSSHFLILYSLLNWICICCSRLISRGSPEPL